MAAYAVLNFSIDNPLQAPQSMPLPLPTSPRTQKHTRKVEFNGFLRSDGLWDIEGSIMDVKPYDVKWHIKPLPAGVPQHQMNVRLTIDHEFNVIAAVASSDIHPYSGFCSAVVPDYGKLVGLNLVKGFRNAVRERFSGVKGCTHITELLGFFPTAAVQTFAGASDDADERHQDDFAFDRCTAMNRRGESVKVFYPQWYIGDVAQNGDTEAH